MFSPTCIVKFYLSIYSRKELERKKKTPILLASNMSIQLIFIAQFPRQLSIIDFLTVLGCMDLFCICQ